jgi:uncharacterized protein YerC
MSMLTISNNRDNIGLSLLDILVIDESKDVEQRFTPVRIVLESKKYKLNEIKSIIKKKY